MNLTKSNYYCYNRHPLFLHIFTVYVILMLSYVILFVTEYHIAPHYIMHVTKKARVIIEVATW